MNIHEKIKLVMRWRDGSEESFENEENLGILRDVIDYASVSPKQYGTVSCSNFRMCVDEILEEIESYNAPLTKLLGGYSSQENKKDRDTVVRELEEVERNAKSGYERDIIRGFRQGLR